MIKNIMNKIKQYLYEIADSTQNVPEATDKCEEELKSSGIICPICGNLLVRGPVDIQIQSRVLKSFAPVTFPSPIRVGMIRRDILTDIGEELFVEWFYLGQVFDYKERLSEEYVTFVSKYPQKELRILGGEESTYDGACESCKCPNYFPLPLNEWHLLEPGYSSPLYPSNWTNSFYVDEKLKNKLKTKGYKKIGYIRLPVL